ncbi:hypothetical protein EJ03DRAFT_331507 [Teratosphaeria nubilosa]|uniref:Hydrophobin n=1 Tax=Teratosphaeria nubilosa TaxID=161662 RepID=A0A6G1KX23_9PEZI|nr:hypothetical protein EJ03DRAFT_331507 [Teratosphaeria nubilosa]
MRSTTLMLLGVFAPFTFAAKPLPKHWCNTKGTAGDGSCEKAGVHTYCCTDLNTGPFTVYREVTNEYALNPQKGRYCDDGQYTGFVMCAKP